ncbi:hypothetical protein GCM10011367_03250 [Marinicauda pacifica]|nr:PIN domain-containing protein [Marinicauda pacifica]GGE32128.1 hypothetical protein GCM10011367_03250 [Marinicauda pacifica]
MMTERRRVYWDACAWLGLINGEPDKAADLKVVWHKAERGQLEVWTSAFCLAEVYKVKCEGGKTGLAAEEDNQIDNLFEQDFVHVVQVDIEIAERARSLLRSHEKLKKPSDAIHLATAVVWNLDQLHTYDMSDLIGLSVIRADGKPLEICTAAMVDGENLFTAGDPGDETE